MDIKKIKAIIELVTESKIAELEISEGEDKLRISTINPKDTYINNVAPQAQMQSQQIIHQPIQSQPSQSVSTATQTNSQVAEPSVIAELHHNEADYITSPMVGTFYRSASPTSSPFVEIGQEVKVGQVLCIIEAMKLMNQIESEKNGVIKDILLKDGSPVEYGQKLFVIG